MEASVCLDHRKGTGIIRGQQTNEQRKDEGNNDIIPLQVYLNTTRAYRNTTDTTFTFHTLGTGWKTNTTTTICEINNLSSSLVKCIICHLVSSSPAITTPYSYDNITAALLS